MNTVMKQATQWFAAIAASIVILNCIVAFYALSPGFLHRDGGATRGVWMPNSLIIKGDEGRSVSRIDGNGYINENDDLADSGYVLFMGNSQSNGIQVDVDKRYILLLNRKLQEVNMDTKVYAYNVSADGSDFCDLVSGFTAATQEFPDSRAVVLQIGSMDWSLDKLQNCTEQRTFSEEQKGAYMAAHLSNDQKLRHMIKLCFPFPIYLKEVKMKETKLDFHDAFWHAETEQEETIEDLKDMDMGEDYKRALEEVLVFLRQNYKGQIIILELPGVSLRGRGKLENSNGIRQKLFDRACKENDIIYINMYDRYEREYEARRVLPYGFSNTRPGYGHLNEEGHQMIADTLLPLLEKEAEE